jgi:hypothetical protein
MEASLRILRVLHAALLLSVLLYAFIGEQVGPKQAKDVTQIQLAVMLASVVSVVILFVVRRKMVAPAEAALRSNAQDAAANGRWRAGYIMSFALSEAIGLYGMVVRMTGGTFRQALPFYAASILLLLIFRPKVPA